MISVRRPRQKLQDPPYASIGMTWPGCAKKKKKKAGSSGTRFGPDMAGASGSPVHCPPERSRRAPGTGHSAEADTSGSVETSTERKRDSDGSVVIDTSEPVAFGQ